VENNTLKAIQLISIILLAMWPILSLFALLKMRRRLFAEWTQIVWTLIIITMPVLGALSFLIVSPGKPSDNQTK